MARIRRRANMLVAFTATSVLLGAVLGALLPNFLPDDGAARAQWLMVIGFPGVLLMNMLKLLVVPLITCTMVVGISSLGDVRKAGRLGARTIVYYATTTGLAVALGILLVSVIRPGETGTQAAAGAAAKLPGALAEPKGALASLLQVIEGMFPPNLFKAAVEMQVLGLIVFSLVLGAVLTTMGERGKPVLRFFEGLNEALMKIVHLVVWFAPIGIASLLMERMGKAGADFWPEVQRLGWYMATVLAGLAIHALVVLPAIYWFVRRRNPFAYIAGMAQALLTAFSTASSSATLPITLDCARNRCGISDRTSGFVLPLGATINMDGTALYEAVAVIFIAQCLGIELSGAQLVIVFLTATLAAIGAAGIPEAGLVMMAIVLTAVGIDPKEAALILAVDWFLDRFRTAVNVAGDAFGAGVIDHYEAAPAAPG
ncbi:MAG: dicarboxylate/amino acid:cation symporter [Planctomycetes bacterium]|nr:dicarboxylate/amino acid:cation symporter [Planctomycetota bacterium]MCL4730684.1 dicarboxylate/amino acid:cation symporter [Planctomycetota bacterium]